MLKLMKYEFKKTMFSKLILLVITAIEEVLFLLGVFLEWENGLILGSVALILTAVFGVMYIGIESMAVLQKDLNTKQSYMLFLPPKNSYQVLGAKVLENGISILLSGLVYMGIAAIDIMVTVLYLGEVKEFLDLLKMMLRTFQVEITFTAGDAVVWGLLLLSSWLLTIIMAYLAIVLCATVFAGKKFSVFVSFLIFLVLSLASSKLMDLIPSMETDTIYFFVMFLTVFIQAGICYFVTGWIMDKKLSV